jgi:hypothetical protein
MLRELPAAASAKLGANASSAQLNTIIAIRSRRMCAFSLFATDGSDLPLPVAGIFNHLA